MKAGSLWQGTDYAYQYYRGRGRPLPLDAKCVKVLDIEQEPIPGGKRSRTKVLVAFMDDEGGAIMEGPDSQPRWVKAEDIIDFWDSYEEERRPLVEEKEQRRIADELHYARIRAEREEREAISSVAWFIRKAALAIERYKVEEQQRLEREIREKHLKRIRNVLITRGFKPDKIVFNGTVVTFDLQEIERWLGISDTEST